ncbi:MAG TPA: 5-oxoprolinase subunit PxpA [Pyrinomonadaceae bacterium]|nr:5-oxoprolinase subunit PxpA [Pyrinomonadaceae bacterium]
MVRQIDLNCDLGEGYLNDAELMKYISSANIACGGHTGHYDSMKRTVELAIENNVAIGAHPSYPDFDNFGRKSINIGHSELSDSITRQIDSLRVIARSFGSEIVHVKPHGALYNDSAKVRELAALIAETVANYDNKLVLFGLANSISIDEGWRVGLRVCGEAFADRTYTKDGNLTPRSESNAFVDSSLTALDNIVQLIDTGYVMATTGERVMIDADTICIHGDGPNAVDFATKLNHGLANFGITIRPKYV